MIARHELMTCPVHGRVPLCVICQHLGRSTDRALLRQLPAEIRKLAVGLDEAEDVEHEWVQISVPGAEVHDYCCSECREKLGDGSLEGLRPVCSFCVRLAMDHDGYDWAYDWEVENSPPGGWADPPPGGWPEFNPRGE
jgi:DUF971 family protein